MSTNGFIVFKVNGQAKVAYNHCDSYPSGLGQDMRKWLTRAVHIPELLEAVAGIEVVREPYDGGREPTEAERAKLEPFTNDGVGGPHEVWYKLLRETQGDPDKIIASGFILDSGVPDEMPWAYVYTVDLDRRVFLARKGGELARKGGETLEWNFDRLPSEQEFTAAWGADYN